MFILKPRIDKVKINYVYYSSHQIRLSEYLYLSSISTVPDPEWRRRSIFITKYNFGILLKFGASRSVEFEPTVVIPAASHSSRNSWRTDPTSGVNDSKDYEVSIVCFGIGAVVADGVISIDGVSVGQRNTAVDDTGRLVRSGSSPGLADHVHPARITVQVASAGHNGINRSVSAVDPQDLAAQSLTPLEVSECLRLSKSYRVGYRVITLRHLTSASIRLLRPKSAFDVTISSISITS